MRCELLALLLITGCASAADKQACHPVASLAGPTFACAGGEPAPPPPVDDKTTTDMTGTEPDETDTSEPEPPPEPAVKLDGDVLAVKDPITFDEDTSTISDSSMITLLEVAKFLDGNPDITKLEIRVHAGGQGTKKKNQKLSDARAKAVKDFLVSKGIAKKRLATKGLGKSESGEDDVELGASQD